jgi:hypothetical protein
MRKTVLSEIGAGGGTEDWDGLSEREDYGNVTQTLLTSLEWFTAEIAETREFHAYSVEFILKMLKMALC